MGKSAGNIEHLMLARAFHVKDLRKLDELTERKSIADSALDEIMCIGPPGDPSGILVYRPGAFVHELECGKGLKQYLIAEALTNYAVGYAKANGLKTAMFLVRGENQAMHRFVKAIGGIKQTEPGDVLYTLTP